MKLDTTTLAILAAAGALAFMALRARRSTTPTTAANRAVQQQMEAWRYQYTPGQLAYISANPFSGLAP